MTPGDSVSTDIHGAVYYIGLNVHFYRAAWMRCDENSVCPSVRLSVCLSNAWLVTKRKNNLFRFLYRTKNHLA